MKMQAPRHRALVDLLPLAVVLVLQGCASAPPRAAAPPAGRSVADGVFTMRQAVRGQRRFEQVCAACHRAREFRGSAFQRAWMSRTVGDLFQLMSDTMPPDTPGSLSPEAYVDILTYVLRLNSYPEGPEELPADPSVLLGVRMQASPDG